MNNEIEDVATILNSGVEFLANGDTEAARRSFLEVINPHRPGVDVLSRSMALYNLGVVEAQAGSTQVAEGWFVQAVAVAREVDFAAVVDLANAALRHTES